MVKALLIFFGLSLCYFSYGVVPLDLREDKTTYTIAPFLELYEDSACTKVVSVDLNDDIKDIVYLKLQAKNSSNLVRWVIGFGNSNEKITLFVTRNGNKVDTFYCGANYTLFDKKIKTGTGEFMVFNVAKDEQVTLLLKLENKSKFSKYLLKYSIKEARIYSPDAFEGNRNISKMINIFFYGAILLMIFYNLMLAITLNSRGYAYYVLFSVLFLCYNFVSDGLIRESFFPNTSNHFHLLRLVITPIMLIVYVQFGRIYMQTSYLVAKADKYVQFLIVLLFACYIPMFFNEWWLARLIILILSIYTVLLTTYVTVLCVNKNYFPARYFLIGNIILTLTALVYVLYILDIIPNINQTKIIEFLPQIGAIFDLALFSLGLANRIQVIEHELVKNEIEAEHEKQALIEEKNLELENRVKERTEELVSQKEEIEAINEELEEKVKERTKKLQKAYRDLLNLNYELDTFIYRAAHDIRGPITTIMGLCNLALIEKDLHKSQEYLKVLEKFSKNTQYTLNRILSVNEIKNSHITLDNFSLLQLKEGVLELVAENKNQAKVTIKFILDEQEIVYYDYNLLKLIIYNLIDNSIRFKNNDTKEIPFCEISIVKIEDEGLVVDVKDNGQGVEENIKEKIFDMFYRGNEYSSGSGLGLYVARLAAKKMNGNVELVSSTKGNTHFRVHLAKLKERRIQLNEVA